MNEKELVNSAKIFQGNQLLNGEKISYADCLKVILLSKMLERKSAMGVADAFTTGEMELILKLIQGRKRAWYKFW